MKEYANKLIEQMLADRLNISEMKQVVEAMQKRLKRITKVKK